jgi:hypothetical protein
MCWVAAASSKKHYSKEFSPAPSPLLFFCRLQACRQHVLGGSSLLQKRSYRVLSYLAASRPEWLAAHLVPVLELLLLGSATALSPAKRYRLRWVYLQELLLACYLFHVHTGFVR